MWLFGDSVGRYATADLPAKYQDYGAGNSGTRVTSGVGRDGTTAVEFFTSNGRLGRAVTSSRPTAFCGFAFKTLSLAFPFAVHTLWDGINNRDQVTYVVNTDGSISAYRVTSNDAFMGWTSGVLLGTTAPGLIFSNVQHHLQFGTTINAATGTVAVKIDGALVLTLTGQNTRNSGASGNTYTMLGVGGCGNGSTYVNDIWMCDDDAGPADGCIDFLGDLVSDACFTTGPGTSTGFTPRSGANYTQVADATPDGDGTYVSSGTVGGKDTYAHSPLVRVATGIKCVQQVTVAEKTTGGSRSICHVLRSGGTDYDSTNLPLPNSYGMQITARPLDPATGVAWANPAAVNATEIGQKVTV